MPIFLSIFKGLPYNFGMAIGFFVIEGPLKGHKFPLEAGQILGRLRGDIILKDPKISGKHAKVERGEQGELVLVDLGSTNGIKINGKRVQSATLTLGLKLQLGRSLVEVVRLGANAEPGVAHDKQPHPKKTPAEPVYTKAPTKQEAEPEPEPTWADVLHDFLTSKRRKVKDRPKVVAPFTPPVVLTFLRGLQFENSWIIGYGPRKIGAKSIDFPILEPQAPDICFEILPTPQGPGFKTANSGMVLLNDKSTNAATLKSGDMITIFDCLIEVSIDETSQ